MNLRTLLVFFFGAGTLATATMCATFASSPGAGADADADSATADASVDSSDATAESSIVTDASTCDADLSSNRDHCGACGVRCSQSCTGGACERTVFVTSVTYQGSFAMEKSGDARCQELATGAGLRGAYLAWLTVANAGPAGRLTHGKTKYRLTNGTLVADDWDQLASQNHRAPIDHTELKTAVPAGVFVWTGSTPFGEPAGPNCGDWTTITNVGGAGTSTALDSQWSPGLQTLACDQYLHLYCIEN